MKEEIKNVKIENFKKYRVILTPLLNVRSEASLESEVVGYLKGGEIIEGIDGGYKWIKTKDGNYCMKSYLEVVEDDIHLNNNKKDVGNSDNRNSI